MRSFIVNNNQNGKRIDNILKDKYPKMPVSSMYKAFRKKDIKVDGIRVKDTHIVSTGDNVEVYIIDTILDGSPEKEISERLDVVFEDANIIIINKEQGISVHKDEGDDGEDTLIALVIKYLSDKGEYDKRRKGFEPALCHRLDRNTGGLVIIAKKEEAHNILLDKIKEREVKKHYLCYVKGIIKKHKDVIEAYLYKDERKSKVFISDTPGKGKLKITTGYKILNHIKGETPEMDLTLVEVDLITGRTHQIRAHFAYIDHPLLGDGKYGINTFNKMYGAKYQALWAYKLKFDFKGNNHILNYLNDMEFEVEPNFKISRLKL